VKSVKQQTLVKRRKFGLGFIGEAISELKKVTWPTRQEALRLTVIVIVLCVILGAILAGVDKGFSELLGLLLR
jgi:preprotein translocase subunit SecE